SQRSQIATHNPKVAGSSPAPATKKDHGTPVVFLFAACHIPKLRFYKGWQLRFDIKADKFCGTLLRSAHFVQASAPATKKTTVLPWSFSLSL
ncbi:MAG TPA: hypothetical protein VMJ94_07940, partial [Nitrososphaera sp.]|nr:hypothetical protein [Nitrososphaera sp.]